MGIIDVNVEKPAFRREESAEDAEEETERSERTEPRSRRGRRLLKTGGIIGSGIIGLLTLRKIRNRRKQRE